MAAAKVMRGEMSREELLYKAPADGQVFGTAAPRPSAKAKVMGMTDYGADIAMKAPDMLYLAMVVPDTAHANILNIDISEAEQAPGVEKVITAKDVPGNNYVNGNPNTSWATGTNLAMDHPVICDKKIFRRGDPVAVIAARSEREARAAAELVHVDYEPLSEYYNSLDSIAEGAVEIQPGTPNAVVRRPLLKGEDTRTYFEKAAYRAEFSISFGKQPHLPIEPDCGNAYVDEDGILTVMYKSHNIYGARRAIAPVANMPLEKIRVIMNPSGGSFGYAMEHFTPALLAVCTLACGGRPVSLIMNYKEHSQYTGKRPGGYSNTRLACDEKGKILAAEADMVVDDGAFTDFVNNLTNCMKFFMNFYNVPNARVIGTTMLTNSQPNSAYRAPGTMEINMNYEQLVDMMAAKIGMDPF
jgi:aldehyde oxidoreductase